MKPRCSICEGILVGDDDDPCLVCTHVRAEEERERTLGVRSFEAQKWRRRQRQNRELVLAHRRRRTTS